MKISVIGTGAVSALGNSADSAWSSIRDGISRLSPITLFDPMTDKKPFVGEITFDLPRDCFSRTESLALAAALQALGSLNLTGLRLGLTYSTTVGGVDRTEKFYRKLLDEPELIRTAANECARHEPGASAGFLAKRLGACGVHTLSTACSTGIHGIGLGAEMIRRGVYDLVLAVGSDALSLLTLRGFDSLLLIDSERARPFDKNRLGISLGEAAGAVLLASPVAKAKLSAKSRAVISGWGASADAYHMTAPHPDGAGAVRSAETALAQAGITPDQIDWICAHGTGTPDNDRAEISAMKRIFTSLPPFSSFKGAMGHTLAASGTVETVYAVEAMNRGWIPGSAGFSEMDPEIGAAPSFGEPCEINHILKNSFGFGGNNGSLIISRGDR